MIKHDLRPQSLTFPLGRLWGGLLLFFAVFPYLQLIPIAGYTQPWALILGVLVLLLQGGQPLGLLRKSDRLVLIALCGLGVSVFFLTCFPYSEIQEYKYLLTYVSPVVLVPLFFKYLTRHAGHATKVIAGAIIIWISVSAVQRFISPGFMSFAIGQWAESASDITMSGRGVLALAPEPTHHAFHMLVMGACLSLLDVSRRYTWAIMFCVLDALFLALSSSAFLVFGVASILWLIVYRVRLAVAVSLAASLLLVTGISFSAEALDGYNVRVVQLVLKAINEGSIIDFLLLDYSVNARLGGAFAIFSYVIERMFLPGGMSLESWLEVRSLLLSKFDWLIDLSLVGPASGVGLIIFQTGIIGAILLGHIFKNILSHDLRGLEKLLVISSPLVFLGQFYISTPVFSLLYACALWRVFFRAPWKC